MTQELEQQHANKLKEVIDAKVSSEKEYRNALRRETEVLELILDIYKIKDVDGPVSIDGKVLTFETKAKKEKK